MAAVTVPLKPNAACGPMKAAQLAYTVGEFVVDCTCWSSLDTVGSVRVLRRRAISVSLGDTV